MSVSTEKTFVCCHCLCVQLIIFVHSDNMSYAKKKRRKNVCQRGCLILYGSMDPKHVAFVGLLQSLPRVAVMRLLWFCGFVMSAASCLIVKHGYCKVEEKISSKSIHIETHVRRVTDKILKLTKPKGT